jgi:hypothetical protein
MRDRVLKPQRLGAGRWLALPVWRHVALICALWGIGWSVPAVSLGFRIAGVPANALANLDERESGSSGEETDSEAIGVVTNRSRSVRDGQTDDRVGVSHLADLSRRGRKSSGGQRGACFHQGGAAIQLPLRC